MDFGTHPHCVHYPSYELCILSRTMQPTFHVVGPKRLQPSPSVVHNINITNVLRFQFEKRLEKCAEPPKRMEIATAEARSWLGFNRMRRLAAKGSRTFYSTAECTTRCGNLKSLARQCRTIFAELLVRDGKDPLDGEGPGVRVCTD